jgi:hypothetical protein
MEGKAHKSAQVWEGNSYNNGTSKTILNALDPLLDSPKDLLRTMVKIGVMTGLSWDIDVEFVDCREENLVQGNNVTISVYFLPAVSSAEWAESSISASFPRHK